MNNKKINKKELAKLEAKMIDSLSKKSNLAWYVNRIILVCIAAIFLLLVYTGKNRSEGSNLSTFTFEEAQARCKERGRVLPITYLDFGNMLVQQTDENKVGYWTHNKTIAKYNMWVFDKDDGAEHHLYCVKKNGQSPSTTRL